MVWTCSRRCCWKWGSEDFVGCYDPMWQIDQGKETQYWEPDKHTTLVHFQRIRNISEESWDGKLKWGRKGTANESGKRDHI